MIDNLLELKQRDQQCLAGAELPPARIHVTCVFKGQKVTRIKGKAPESKLGVIRWDLCLIYADDDDEEEATREHGHTVSLQQYKTWNHI